MLIPSIDFVEPINGYGGWRLRVERNEKTIRSGDHQGSGCKAYTRACEKWCSGPESNRHDLTVERF